ncbi:MAG: DUF2163 domain-containing protein [Spirochaetes bacterium]|nr:DUF2163 domain-containing protein [Spirochaetota bacterium]
MRTLSAQLQTAVALEANKPIELYEIYLDDVTLRYANYTADVTFNSELYTAIGIGRSNTRTDIKLSPDSVNVSIDNVNRYFSDLVESGTEFRGKQVKILKVFIDYLAAAANYVVMFDGLIDTIQIDQYQINLTVQSPLASLNTQCPRRNFSPLCHWRYGDSDCGITVETLNNVTIQSYISSDMSLICFMQNIANEDREDYWKSGYITIESSTDSITNQNAGISRKIGNVNIDGYSSKEWKNNKKIILYLTSNFPYAVRGFGITLATVKKGCDKTKTDCLANDNIYNFGGFLSIVDDFKFTTMVIE